MKLEQWFKNNTWDDYFAKFEEKCKGRYEEIFDRCGGSLMIESLNYGGNSPKPVGCPNHHGKTNSNYVAKVKFKGVSRPFNDYAIGCCNTCGTKSGIFHLRWIRGDSKMKETLNAIRIGMGWSWGYILDEPLLDKEMTAKEREAFLQKENTRKELAEQQRRQREQEAKKKDLQRANFIQAKNRELFDTCLPLNHPNSLPAVKYFLSRGIDVLTMPELTRHIRFSPGYEVFASGVKYDGLYMSIVSKIINGVGELLYWHRIIIDEHGNKMKPHTVANNEKVFGPSKIKGSAIPGLDNSNRGIKPFKPFLVQGVSEGLEVALSVRYMTGLPVDSATDAVSMENWLPQDGVKVVLIFEDYDRPNDQHPNDGGRGAAAGENLCEKLLGKGILPIRLSPPFEIPQNSKSVDWNDVIANFGSHELPKSVKEWKQLEDDIAQLELFDINALNYLNDKYELNIA